MNRREKIGFLNLTLEDVTNVVDRIPEDETFLNIIQEAGYSAKKNNIKELRDV